MCEFCLGLEFEYWVLLKCCLFTRQSSDLTKRYINQWSHIFLKVLQTNFTVSRTCLTVINYYTRNVDLVKPDLVIGALFCLYVNIYY